MQNENTGMRKVLYLALAIVMAVTIWVIVDETNATTASVTITDVPIEYLNNATLADRGLMLVTGTDSGTDEKLDLTFEGRRRLVAGLDRSKLLVTADLNRISEAGMQSLTYNVSFTDRKFYSDTVRVTQSSHDMAAVNICELNRKVVEVRCELKGNVAEGYSAGQLMFSPDTVEIRGQVSDIADVSYAKVVLDIGKNAKDTVIELLDYELCTITGEVVDRAGIHTTVEQIEVEMPISVTKELKLLIDFQEAPGASLKDMKWKLQPETVIVAGDASVLNNLDSIVLDSFDLLNVGRENSMNSYFIVVPDGCENLSGVTRAMLQISHPTKTSALVTTGRFRYENPPTDKDLEILTEEMTVEIFGAADEVQSVTGNDIVVVADLADYSEASGTYTVPARIETDYGVDVGILGEYQVKVTIRENNPWGSDTGEES